MKKIIAAIIASIILFSCDSNQNITSFKVKNPYLTEKKIINETVSVSILPRKADNVEQNINRWRNQLNLPTKNNINTELIKSPFESIGEYHLVHEINNDTNQAILGAIINQKNKTIFIKMNTSAILSYDRRYEFQLFCQSLYFDENKNLIWTAPKNWIEKEPIPMSIAYFEIKKSNEN